ncbi:MAG: hypothetical protein II297_05420 [Clostridia bacterium]|nr:hypothetical protein [Clostridia bacterium]
MGAYDSIINLPHHQSQTRPKMSLLDRAAQFAPFAALNGYDDAVKETARLTDGEAVLDDGQIAWLNERLMILSENTPTDTEVEITYFIPDEKKDGGKYLTVTGRVQKILEFEGLVIMQSCEKIPVEKIVSIEGELFREIDEGVI